MGYIKLKNGKYACSAVIVGGCKNRKRHYNKKRVRDYRVKLAFISFKRKLQLIIEARLESLQDDTQQTQSQVHTEQIEIEEEQQSNANEFQRDDIDFQWSFIFIYVLYLQKYGKIQ